METTSEVRLARNAYGWLRVSPLLTVFTFSAIWSIDPGGFLCSIGICQDEIGFYITTAAAILGSALWHLILLQYVNHKVSPFVSRHGKRALTYAGIRTTIPLGVLLIDFAGKAEGMALGCIAIPILILLWAVNTRSGYREIEREVGTQGDQVPDEGSRIITGDNSTSVCSPKTTESPSSKSGTPQEALDKILSDLKSATAADRMQALEELKTMEFSNEAIRLKVEELALHDDNPNLSKEALTVLTLTTHQNVASNLTTVPKYDRSLILGEIGKWLADNIIDGFQAEVIKRRYDFDLEKGTSSKTQPDKFESVPIQPAATAPKSIPPIPQTPQPVTAAVSAPATTKTLPPKLAPRPTGPRPSLLQTLLSETSIKIYLYLGAFFVIASAVILGTLFEAARLPILVAGSLIFGGTAVGIRRRLPQPSFALFIVFSFLLPITANVISQLFNLTPFYSPIFWTIVFSLMALIWGGSTRLYESRLFSITAFLSLVLAFYRLGDLFNAQVEFYLTMVGLAALVGLLGVWTLKKWRNFKFALPLFFSAQLIQFTVLIISMSIYFLRLFEVGEQAVWNLSSIFTLIFACLFFITSDLLNPFFIFPWLAAGMLIPMPWLLIASFSEDPFSNNYLGMVVFSPWGLILSFASEAFHRTENFRRYSLPLLLASIPTFAFAVISGLLKSDEVVRTTYGLAIAFGIAGIYAILHTLRPRGWLWAISITFFIVAYFSLFNLRLFDELNIFTGFKVLGLSLLFLLPDLFLKKDLEADRSWRLPPRIYGAMFSLSIYLGYSPIRAEQSLFTGIMFGILAVLFTLYSVCYQRPLIGYFSALGLVIGVIHVLDHLNLDLWFEALSVLAVLYYLGGFLLSKNKTLAGWRAMLASCGLTLGSITALIALVTLKEFSGWYAAATGTLYILEMYNRRQGFFEVGAQLQIPASIFLVLNDFKPGDIIYIMLGWSICWLGLDMIFSKTFSSRRRIILPVRIGGSLATAVATLVLLADGDATLSAICFGIYTTFFTLYTIVQRNAIFGYIPAAFLSLAVFFTLDHFNLEAWLPVLTALTATYFLSGFLLRKYAAWSFMLRNSSLGLGSILSLSVWFNPTAYSGWTIALISLLFIIEMYVRRQGQFEIGPQLLLPAAVYLILGEFKITDLVYTLLGLGLTWLLLDLLFTRTFKQKRWVEWPARLAGAAVALFTTLLLISENDAGKALICFAILTVFFLIYTLVHRKSVYAYLPAAYLPLTVFYTLEHLKIDAWLPCLTGLAVVYLLAGLAIRAKEDWSSTLRNCALTLGVITSLGALIVVKSNGGWYALVAGLLFVAEMHLRRNGWFEFGLPAMFNIGAFLILNDIKIEGTSYHLLAYSLVWLLSDLLAHLTFIHPRMLKWPIRGIGALITIINFGIMFDTGSEGDALPAAIGFGVYSALFLIVSLAYRRPNLLYPFTLSLPLFAAFLFRVFEQFRWIHPVMVIAVVFYIIGFFFRRTGRAAGWDTPLTYSGLGLGLLVSAAAPIFGGLDAVIPVALAATLWALEASAQKNVWLGFPANALYLLAYFIILFELKVDEVQFFSMGAALLGLIQHYLLNRAGNKTASFITGMISQLALLGTTYIQMLNTELLIYFVVLFLQSIAVLIYGIIIRSRSLTFTPIGLVVLGVVTVIYSALKDISTVVLIGCTGIILLILGILAVVLRERITRLGERLSSWQA